MLHALGPGHLAHVYQTFDTLLQLYESPVVGHAQDTSLDPCADWIPLSRSQPGIGGELLEAQRNPQLLRSKLQHLNLDLVAHMHKVAWMRQTAPGHIRDVQKTVNASQVHKSAV